VPWLVPGLLLLPVPWLLDVLPWEVPGRLFLLLLVLSPYMHKELHKRWTELKRGNVQVARVAGVVAQRDAAVFD
jgi:hypothetical protein